MRRQKSNPVLPVGPTTKGESHFPTQSNTACSYRTESQIPITGWKYRTCTRSMGCSQHHHTPQQGVTAFMAPTQVGSGVGLRGTNSMAVQERHLQPSAVVLRSDINQTASHRALQPHWLGTLRILVGLAPHPKGQTPFTD